MAILDPMTDRGSWSELIAGIVSDATRLFAKEIELARLEIRADIRNTKSLLTGIATGAMIAREKYSAARTTTEARSKSDIRTTLSCFKIRSRHRRFQEIRPTAASSGTEAKD